MRKIYIIFILMVSFLSYIIFSCQNQNYKNIKEGEALAKINCASCHLFPEPGLLDKNSWSTVLPKMAEFMHVKTYFNPFDNAAEEVDSLQTRVAPDSLFPEDNWLKIYNYYITSSPVNPVIREKVLPEIETGLKIFKTYDIADKFKNPLTTFVQIDTTAGGFWFADGSAEKLFRYNAGLIVSDSVSVQTGVVAQHLLKDGREILSMGVLAPSDKKSGKLTAIGTGNKTSIILDSLNRPVHIQYADLNNDAKDDIVICEFGFRSGGLSWYENIVANQYRKNILRLLPGATATEIYDFNKDGKPDIIALMAQGDEGLFIYYNEGNGKFREENIIRFPPVYGSNHFSLFDYNGDGHMDVLTTNGDNADYSISLKAYHGIRIFVNDGKNRFEEKIFLPVYGIQKAIPADFDKDGDIDIASIAYYPDFEKNPKESFIYWENSGNNNYNRFTFAASASGRWMTMDAGDMDGDGDKDLILGSVLFPFGEVPQQLKNAWSKRPVSVVILKNTLVD